MIESQITLKEKDLQEAVKFWLSANGIGNKGPIDIEQMSHCELYVKFKQYPRPQNPGGLPTATQQQTGNVR